MAAKPKKVEIRAFQVGFGDCFLLTFVYGDADRRHVLIDFGTTGLPKGLLPKDQMKAVAARIKEIVDGKQLTAVVATHRHADHISGFGTDGRTGGSGIIIKELRPKLVLQPWTEDPAARPNARTATTAARGNKGFVAALKSMNDIAGSVRRLADDKGNRWMSAAVRKELAFLGEDNIANKSAVDNLIAMGKARRARARYLRHGDKSGLEVLLPGVTVHVLGPPDLSQTEKIRKQRSTDRDQFWHFARSAVASHPDPAAMATNGGARNGARADRRDASVVPAAGRWFRDRLQNLTGQSLLEIVRQLDQQMNNTSLILLFEVNGKKLLFPGDAQLENWSYALVDAPSANAVQAMLADVDLYKVGHHGSLNATPRKLLWDAFKKRKNRELQTMMSTMAGKHGHAKSKTEVPRKTLHDALKSQSRLKNTQDLKADEELLTEIDF